MSLLNSTIGSFLMSAVGNALKLAKKVINFTDLGVCDTLLREN